MIADKQAIEAALDRLAAARDILDAPLPADPVAADRSRAVRLGYAHSAIVGVYDELNEAVAS
ncbi:MAG: hypothetical protein KY442_06490 [Proteobacteria bacterium]|nr:hypothetical protein [Pseudomonadota bacterium]